MQGTEPLEFLGRDRETDSTRRSSRCSSSARATRSSACSSRTSPAAASGGSSAVEDEDGALVSLCHLGANLVPSGDGCGAFAEAAVGHGVEDDHRRGARGRRALGDGRGARCREPRADRPGQPVYAIAEPPPPGDTGLRAATLDDLELLLPVCAAAHEVELGVDPLARDAEGFRWRTRAQIADAPLVALARGRRDPLQGGGLGVDAGGRADPAGLGRPGRARPRLRRARAARPLPAAARRRRRS